MLFSWQMVPFGGKPCLETLPHNFLQTPFAGHCLAAVLGVNDCVQQMLAQIRTFWSWLKWLPKPWWFQVRDGVRDKQEPSLGQMWDKSGLVPGTSRPLSV